MLTETILSMILGASLTGAAITSGLIAITPSISNKYKELGRNTSCLLRILARYIGWFALISLSLFSAVAISSAISLMYIDFNIFLGTIPLIALICAIAVLFLHGFSTLWLYSKVNKRKR